MSGFRSRSRSPRVQDELSLSNINLSCKREKIDELMEEVNTILNAFNTSVGILDCLEKAKMIGTKAFLLDREFENKPYSQIEDMCFNLTNDIRRSGARRSRSEHHSILFLNRVMNEFCIMHNQGNSHTDTAGEAHGDGGMGE